MSTDGHNKARNGFLACLCTIIHRVYWQTQQRDLFKWIVHPNSELFTDLHIIPSHMTCLEF